MRSNTAALVIAGALGLIEMVATLAFGFTNPVFGALFVFALPGYTVSSVIFDMRRLNVAERVLLSIGGSVALAILGGLALDATPWGLATASWGALLGGVTAGGAIMALIRRWQFYEALPPIPLNAGDRYFRSPLVHAMALISAILVIAAFAISLASAHQTVSPGFTQLWVLPSADSRSIQIGVSNHEHSVERYSLKILVSGKAISTMGHITLAPGQTWTTSTELPKQAAGVSAQVPVQAILYLANAPDQPYRQALIWVGGAG